VKMQTVFRKEKNPENPYVMVNKGVANDERLTWQARGLMLHLLSLPDDWQMYEVELVKRAPNGKSSLKSIIKELMGYGYIERSSLRNTKGQFNGYEYRVYEDCNRVRFSDNGLSNNGKSATTNNNLTNNKNNNNLQISEKSAYLFFNDLKETDPVRLWNEKIESGRSKISISNYNKVRKRLEPLSPWDIQADVNKYLKDKPKGRSMENFIKHMDRYDVE